MDTSQISDMQEMTMIFTQFKNLYLRNPEQSEISIILKERKSARSAEIPPTQTVKQLF